MKINIILNADGSCHHLLKETAARVVVSRIPNHLFNTRIMHRRYSKPYGWIKFRPKPLKKRKLVLS